MQQSGVRHLLPADGTVALSSPPFADGRMSLCSTPTRAFLVSWIGVRPETAADTQLKFVD